jgi:predicted ATP-grasp superfamily ATP-dependent carboligase
VIEQVFEYLDQIKYSGLVQKEELQQKIEGSLELLEKIKRSG